MDAGRQRPARRRHRPRDPLVVARAASPTSLLLSYSGVTLEPLPFRLSANGDHVDDRATEVVRSPARRASPRSRSRAAPAGPPSGSGRGRLGPGAVKVNVDPKRLRLGDGVYVVVARFTPDDGSGETEQRRRVIFDRTLSALTARLDDDRRRARARGPGWRSASACCAPPA